MQNLFYIIGSLCFIVGSLIAWAQKPKPCHCPNDDEDYPGQKYFHAFNKSIRNTELNFQANQRILKQLMEKIDGQN